MFFHCACLSTLPCPPPDAFACPAIVIKATPSLLVCLLVRAHRRIFDEWSSPNKGSNWEDDVDDDSNDCDGDGARRLVFKNGDCQISAI